MKKFAVVASLMVLGAGVAFASSIGIPWFADNSPNASGFPPSAGLTTLVYVHNNDADPLVCQIQYFNQDGDPLGPDTDNTFEVEPNASVSFRPVADDPVASGGQESPAGQAVPNRPTDVDTKKNGSAVIRWFGESALLQGMLVTAGGGGSYAHLLPPGF